MLFCSPSLEDRGTTSIPMEMLTSHRAFFLGANLALKIVRESLNCVATWGWYRVGVVLNPPFFVSNHLQVVH